MLNGILRDPHRPLEKHIYLYMRGPHPPLCVAQEFLPNYLSERPQPHFLLPGRNVPKCELVTLRLFANVNDIFRQVE